MRRVLFNELLNIRRLARTDFRRELFHDIFEGLCFVARLFHGGDSHTFNSQYKHERASEWFCPFNHRTTRWRVRARIL